MKSVCITGHRDISEGKIDYVREQLRKEVEQAIEDGFTLFLCGMLIMAYNMAKTMAGGKTEDAPVLVPAGHHA